MALHELGYSIKLVVASLLAVLAAWWLPGWVAKTVVTLEFVLLVYVHVAEIIAKLRRGEETSNEKRRYATRKS